MKSSVDGRPSAATISPPRVGGCQQRAGDAHATARSRSRERDRPPRPSCQIAVSCAKRPNAFLGARPSSTPPVRAWQAQKRSTAVPCLISSDRPRPKPASWPSPLARQGALRSRRYPRTSPALPAFIEHHRDCRDAALGRRWPGREPGLSAPPLGWPGRTIPSRTRRISLPSSRTPGTLLTGSSRATGRPRSISTPAPRPRPSIKALSAFFASVHAGSLHRLEIAFPISLFKRTRCNRGFMLIGADRDRSNLPVLNAAVPSSRARPCPRLRPAARCHRSVGQPAEPHRGRAEDLDLEHARARPRAVQRRAAGLPHTFAETLTDHAWTGDLSLQPGLAESFKRIDGRTLELKLRQERALPQWRRRDRRGRGLQLRAERMWTGSSVDTRGMWTNYARPHQQGAAAQGARSRWPPIPASSGWRSSTNTPSGSSTACPTRRWKSA